MTDAPTLDKTNYATRMLRAMTGPRWGLRAAWLSFLASYHYTRSWDGCEGPDGQPMSFGRWYAFKGGVECGWRYLWPRK